MADSVDRVFVHALSTVKRIPKTGAMRPPPAERLRLYGLYKQAMEGDVDGVMERPTSAQGLRGEDLQRERDKWDAWNSQRGLSKTEAKRRYIETLLDTMHRYATTGDAMELVSELEFVWTQVKNNTPSLSSSPSKSAPKPSPEKIEQSAEGPMKVLSPMSEQDEAERETRRQIGDVLDDEDEGGEGDIPGSSRWSHKVERALVKLSTEVAALREQITTGREWRYRKEMSWRAWAAWMFWAVVKHLVVDLVALSVVLIWMRKRKDRRLEDLVRAALRLAREYVRDMLPAR
ncbi:hypothetical protein VUR80DRAFT_1388 [Thermomyces stellatus]